ncbi:hypothetical protein [Erwinia sp. Leaf53]|uniref:hypothetical protein n=1 Tax=Erwinia sp. Leaf53 TaxID=1736225 RepID=UPI000A50E810|nr:hypothetical protein [Erwinia sp. Leaf53]
MKKIKKVPFFLLVISFATVAERDVKYKFSDFHVREFLGGFSDRIRLSDTEKHYSKKWKNYVQSELIKPVNFSGHYRVAISKNGELPQECGNKGWVCGWVLDKLSGRVVSELPMFNDNTKYFLTIDNGTPLPDLFFAEFYPNSSMIRVSGQNRPKKKAGIIRCANSAYEFKNEIFTNLDSGRCVIDVGSDMNADKFLP